MSISRGPLFGPMPLTDRDPGDRSFSPSRPLWTPSRVAAVLAVAAAVGFLPLAGSDHSDVPQEGGLVRQDANLTDLHAFVARDNLVIALCSNPAIPKSATNYLFPSDVTFEVNLDLHSPVSPLDPAHMGGTILEPDNVEADVTFRVRFNDDGQPVVHPIVRRSHKPVPIVSFFAGLRDDPFIRGPRQGRNVAAIVLEVPLAALTEQQSTLLLWATSKVDDFEGPFQDLVGRSLRSMMPENNAMNTMPVRQQSRFMGVPPDVMIYNTALPAAYPNGRALTDDVIDLVGDPRLLANDAPFPAANDLPFLSVFPYLAPPHPPQ